MTNPIIDTPFVNNPLIETPFSVGAAPACEVYSGVLLVGNNGGTFGYDNSLFGDLTPDNMGGEEVRLWNFIPIGGNVQLNIVGSIQIPGGADRSILVTIGTHAEVDIPWAGASYALAIQTLADYIEAEVGNSLNVCINWGT